MTNPLDIVDVSEITPETSAKLVDAASQQGFVFVKGHGFSRSEVDRLFTVSQEYFAQPSEEKMKTPIGPNNIGYQNGSEQLNSAHADAKETLNMDPKHLPHDDKFLSEAVAKLHQLCLQIHRGLALGLGIDEEAGGKEYFTDKYDLTSPSGSIFRFLHYPSGGSQEQIRAGAHTDYGGVTLLFQKRNQEGLEIYSKSWQPVPFVDSSTDEAPPIIVNVGDQLSYWTAGKLKSTVHRVKFPPQVTDRYSIVFFCHPSDNTPLTPIPSDQIRHLSRGANTGDVITAKQHLQKRLAATYGWTFDNQDK